MKLKIKFIPAGLTLLLFLLISVSGCTKNNKQERFWPGLVGAYYGNEDLTHIKFTEVLTSLDNKWDEDTGHGSAWSAKYEGYIISPLDGILNIYFESNKILIFTINQMKGQADSSTGKVSRSFESKKGQKHYLALSFLYPKGAAGGFRVSWSREGHGEETIPQGAFVFDSEQSKRWNRIPEADPDTIDYSKFPGPADLKHTTVFYEKGKFAGWPANGGIWNWGDEIVVNFTVGFYKEIENHHSIDESQPQQSVLARSLDGGNSWKVAGTFVIDELAPKKLPDIDFSHPDLAIKVFRKNFIVSFDRCKSWSGYYPFPDFGYEKLTNRTDYIPVDQNSCVFFLSHEDKTVQAQLADKAFAAITRDGGKTFVKLGDICPHDNYRAVMPSTVQLSENHFISALRRRFDEEFADKKPKLPGNWIDLFESDDAGGTWHFLSKVADTDMGKHNGNPPSLLKMTDGRLCITYGYRAQPYGIRAKLSKDNGKTWSPEIHLRDHAREFDMGYTRSVQRADGKIVTVYYYNTADIQEQFIAASIWDPDTIEF